MSRCRVPGRQRERVQRDRPAGRPGRLVQVSPWRQREAVSRTRRERRPRSCRAGVLPLAATLNYVRALISGGFADIRHPDNWTVDHVRDDATRAQYQATVDSVLEALSFAETVGASQASSLGAMDFFTSHEASAMPRAALPRARVTECCVRPRRQGLILAYEEAMTRQASNGAFYDTSAHFLWIGDRTRQIDHAHVEYFR